MPDAQATAPTPAKALIASEASEWDGLVGTAFQLSTPTGKVPMTLASLERITDATRPADLARHQPFYATFQMSGGDVPKGGETYRLSHATRGEFDLFLGMPSVIQGKSVLTALLN